ncbi:MAG: Ig-like domain-containing protein, partial [Phycisphaerae bacterium]
FNKHLFSHLWVISKVAAANTAPTAAAVSDLTTPDTAVSLTLDATDVDGDALSYVIATLPSSGTVKVGDATLASGDLPYTIPDGGKVVTYTPAATTHGSVTFTYKANDGTVDSSAATVTVIVNQAPAATAATAIIPLNKDAKITLAGTDPDGDTLSYTVVSVPGHGVLTVGTSAITTAGLPFALGSGKKEVTYTPDAGYHGPDDFTFTVADTWQTSEPATQTIQVNTRPTVVSFTVYAPPAGEKDITLRGADADRDPICYVLLSLPAHGTLKDGGQELETDQLPYTVADAAGTVQYSPVAGYMGTDSFHYEVTDGIETSSLGIVSIAINSPPIGADAAAVADATGKAVVTLLPTDADGDTLQVNLLTLPSHGTISIGGSAVTDTTKAYAVPSGGLPVTYQVAYDYAGTDAFTWQVTDAKDTAGPYRVSVSVPSAVPAPATTEPTAAPSEGTGGNGSAGSEPAASPETSRDLSNVDFDPCGSSGPVEAAALSLTVTAGMLSTSVRRSRSANRRRRV